MQRAVVRRIGRAGTQEYRGWDSVREQLDAAHLRWSEMTGRCGGETWPAGASTSALPAREASPHDTTKSFEKVHPVKTLKLEYFLLGNLNVKIGF